MEPVRIAIVEDDPATARRFADMFGSVEGFRVVGAAATGREALALLERERLDTLIVDLGLPDMDGTEVIRACARLQSDCDPVVVTIFGDDDRVIRCLEAGATGYLLKDDMPADIVEAVRSLRKGGSPVSPRIARRILSRFRSPASGAEPARPAEAATLAEPLSAREREILELVSKGLSSAEIGEVLHISAHTVGTHVKNIYRKLAVHSRVEAVYEARHLGLLRE